MRDLINLGSQFIGFHDEAATLRGKTTRFLTYFQFLPRHCSPSVEDSLPSNLFPSEALRRAEERADALEAKLKSSETARLKAEEDAAAVEGLRQRLRTAEDALSEKEARQIERENAIVERFNTQNRRFTSKLLRCLPFASVFICFSDVDEFMVCSSRADG
jgi:vacuolar-type H+-ATPase subunit I/STV1